VLKERDIVFAERATRSESEISFKKAVTQRTTVAAFGRGERNQEAQLLRHGNTFFAPRARIFSLHANDGTNPRWL
jgi:hypothetical protein